METRGEPYPVFRVSYAGTRCYQPGWSIEVRPVPRALKHAVQDAMTTEFLPAIREWLQNIGDLHSQYGQRAISVIMDERGETLLRLVDHTPAKHAQT
jgi:hypothetical protein